MPNVADGTVNALWDLDMRDRTARPGASQGGLRRPPERAGALARTGALRSIRPAPPSTALVGRSRALARVKEQIEAVAPTQASVLLTGESGVGKELVARAIHSASLRAARKLVTVNSAAIPDALFESELFGHVRGAFTGAVRSRLGRLEAADAGTLFLDEVGEIPRTLQPKLLRALDLGEFERVGESKTRSVDVRVISATNADLESLIAAGDFREDLFYRLSVFPLEIPPLRERTADLEPLADHFLKEACRALGRSCRPLDRQQVKDLASYRWPGNVRELRNVIERSVIMATGEHARIDLAMAADGSQERSFLTEEELKQFERRNLVAALARSGWKVSGAGGAAELLGVKPTTLASRMKRLGVARSRSRSRS